MINRLTIQNFKSISHQEINFHEVNLIIGANNSGKSNLLDSLFTIQNIFRYPIQDAFGRGPYSYGATFSKVGDKSLPMVFRVEGSYSSIQFDYEIKLISKHSGKYYRPTIQEETLIWGERKYTNTTNEDKSLIYSPPENANNEDIRLFKRALQAKKYQFVPRVIKQEHPIPFFDTDYTHGGNQGLIPYLSHDGSNLLEILYHMREDNIVRFSDILKDCQKFFPHLKDIRIQTGMGDSASIQVSLKQGRNINLFNGVHLSDGFAIILSILTLLDSDTLPHIVMIEELENGLNPSSIEKVLAKMFEVSSQKDVQFIISTHSPVFLQLLRKQPQSVIICEQNDSGQSQYISLDKKLEFFKEDYESGDSLFDLWLSGLIGGL
jgi:predicted ATPase